MLKYRARRLARQHWAAQHKGCYENHPFGSDIRKGFEEAYVETAMGMKGCPPPVPTRRLVSVETVTHTYPAAGPWFQGYRIGHASAVASGVDRWRFAPVDPAIAAAFAQRQCVAQPYRPVSTEPVFEHQQMLNGEGPEPIPPPAQPPEPLEPVPDLTLRSGP